MKKHVRIFILAALLGLAVIPAANLLFHPVPPGETRWSQHALFNMDHAAAPVNRVLSWLGVSADPDQVIIGREGWYFLGDEHSQTLSNARQGQTQATIELAQRVSAAAESWDDWMRRRGVKAFRIMLGPDKSTIYQEYLPDWAKPAQPTPLDALVENGSQEVFLDLRPILAGAKANSPTPLYYRTDTHWNAIGAGAAFMRLAQSMAAVAPDLRWPSASDLEARSVAQRKGGDLARFLRFDGQINEPVPVSGIESWPLETWHIDLDSGREVFRGGNMAVEPSVTPLLVVSPNALNKRRVLWLRDSFGTAMAPYMAATFSEVVQLHWQEAIKPEGRMAGLIEEWKPDYVFMTVVERRVLSETMATFPLQVTNTTVPGFIPRTGARPPVSTNDISQTGTDSYLISGPDAFLDVPLQASVKANQAPLLQFGLECADGAKGVRMQIFWHIKDESYYSEIHSAHITVDSGHTSVDLGYLPDWKKDVEITRLRFDIDPNPEQQCAEFSLQNVQLGISEARFAPDNREASELNRLDYPSSASSDSVAATRAPHVDVAGALALKGNRPGFLDASSIHELKEGGRCALDSVNGLESEEIGLARTAQIRFSGWAASVAPAPALTVVLAGETNYAFPAELQADRPDVAAAIGIPGKRVSDYHAQVDLGDARPGTYTAYLLIDDAGTPVKCPLNRQVKLL